jgi:hypothetical protein
MKYTLSPQIDIKIDRIRESKNKKRGIKEKGGGGGDQRTKIRESTNGREES